MFVTLPSLRVLVPCQCPPSGLWVPAMASAGKISAKRRMEILRAAKMFEGKTLLQEVLRTLQADPVKAGRVLSMLESGSKCC